MTAPMTLPEAIEEARRRGLGWVAQERDGRWFAHRREKPSVFAGGFWDSSSMILLGTGSPNPDGWRDTLTEVMVRLTPQNGTKTHPLKPAALRVLAALKSGPAPCSTLNPGVVNRLLREGVVEIVSLPSPFKTHNGRSIPHLRFIDNTRRDADA